MEAHPETQALRRRLDEVYAGLRNRARVDWLRNRPGEDPSDACVSVRVECDNSRRLAAPVKVH